MKKNSHLINTYYVVGAVSFDFLKTPMEKQIGKWRLREVR